MSKELKDTIKELTEAIDNLIAVYKRLEDDTGLNPLRDLGNLDMYKFYLSNVEGNQTIKLIRVIFIDSKYNVVRNSVADSVLVEDWGHSVPSATVLAKKLFKNPVYTRGFVMTKNIGVAYFMV